MKNSMLRYILIAASFLTVSELSIAASSEKTITMAVANSTCNAIKEVGQVFENSRGITINYQCKSSGRLAKGLNGEAITADIYISASKKWMDFMLEKELIRQEDVISPWGNQLVVAAAANGGLMMEEWKDLTSDRIETILIGDPGTAPFGRYAKQALKETGLWEQIKHKIVTKKHITLLADSLAEAGASTVGILFVSNITDSHRVVYSVDDSWHAPIRYFAAPLPGSEINLPVVEMMRFLQGAEAQQIFRNSGFKVFQQ